MKKVKTYKGYKIYETNQRERTENGITSTHLLFTPDEEQPAIGYQEWEADSLEELVRWVDGTVGGATEQPEAPEITDELLADLATFTDKYVDEVRTAVIKNIANIAKDATLVKLLREYATRKQKELDDYRQALKNTAKYGMEFRLSNNCLTHSSSYRDVIYDLLRPYWEEARS